MLKKISKKRALEGSKGTAKKPDLVKKKEKKGSAKKKKRAKKGPKKKVPLFFKGPKKKKKKQGEHPFFENRKLGALVST